MNFGQQRIENLVTRYDELWRGLSGQIVEKQHNLIATIQSWKWRNRNIRFVKYFLAACR